MTSEGASAIQGQSLGVRELRPGGLVLWASLLGGELIWGGPQCVSFSTYVLSSCHVQRAEQARSLLE